MSDKYEKLADAIGGLNARMDAIEGARKDANVSYRSSGYDLATAGSNWADEKKTMAWVKSQCSSAGLDKDQTEIVISAFKARKRGEPDE